MSVSKDIDASGRKIRYLHDLEDGITVLVLTPNNGQKPWNPSCVWGIPGIVWGPPGIGKTYRVEAAGLGLGMRTESVIPATRQPEDVAGAAYPDGQGGLRIASLLPGVRRLIEDKQGILFIDELSCARPAVQAAFLGVPLERRVGEDRLPPGVRVIAAANPPNEAAGGWDLEPPMANRFVHLYSPPPDGEAWVDWLMNEKDVAINNIEDGEATIRAGWQNAFSRAKGLVAGFHKKTGHTHIFAMPKEGSADRGRAWASPRTWEMLTRLFATCHILGKGNVLGPMLHGCVGRGIALEFETWLEEADLPDFDDVLNLKWKPNSKRLDKTVAAYTSVTSRILQERDEKKKVEYATAYWSALQLGIDSGAADVVHKSAVALVAGGLGRRNAGTASTAQPVMTVLAKMGMANYV